MSTLRRSRERNQEPIGRAEPPALQFFDVKEASRVAALIEQQREAAVR